MRKITLIGMALALTVGAPIAGTLPARAGEVSAAQAAGAPAQPAAGQDPQFSSYWFVYGEPPYPGGVAPWKQRQADPDSEFNSYWFVYGEPPYDNEGAGFDPGAAAASRSQRPAAVRGR